MSSKTSWFETRLPAFTAWRAHFADPVLAREAPYLSSLPTIITGALIFMALSGFVLSAHYDPAAGFASLQFIDRDVPNGWLVHAFHSAGTTMIFGAVYLNLFRQILARSYKAPGEFLWFLGLVQFALLLLVGWLGYTLTDGAAAYWSLHGAEAQAASLGGWTGAIGSWFFGGDGGLARMVTLHVGIALAVFAIVALYYAGSRAVGPRLGRGVAFHPYYTAQYFVAFVVFALIFAILVFFAPHFGSHPLNAVAGNPLVVPVAAAPPWYLTMVADASHLAPGKAGLWLVVARFAVLFALPWLDRSKPGAAPKFLYRLFVFLLAADVIGLGLAVAAGPSVIGSLLVAVFTVWYFLHFLVITPVVTAMEAV
jgi:ubiquinol-cytochrome c reductase cytochrome b subunit